MTTLAQQLQTLRADARLSVDELAAVFDLPAAVVWVLLDDGTVNHDRVDGAGMHVRDVEAALTEALSRLRLPMSTSVSTSTSDRLAP